MHRNVSIAKYKLHNIMTTQIIAKCDCLPVCNFLSYCPKPKVTGRYLNCPTLTPESNCSTDDYCMHICHLHVTINTMKMTLKCKLIIFVKVTYSRLYR